MAATSKKLPKQFRMPEETLVNGRHMGMCHHIVCFELSNKYQNLEFIATGGSGAAVCGALNTETNQKVAIKQLCLKKFPNLLNALRELKVSNYMGTNSKAIITLLDVEIPATRGRGGRGWEFDTLYLIYEHLPMTIDQAIKTGELEQKDHKLLLAQMLFGLRDIHHANIVHRDISPCNLLMDFDHNLKIIDFGSARAMKKRHPEDQRVQQPTDSFWDDEKIERQTDMSEIVKDMLYASTSEEEEEEYAADDYAEEEYAAEDDKEALTKGIGTIGYRAPELTLGCETYSKPADIWAVACVFYEMVTKSKLFKSQGNTDEDQFNAIISKLGSSFITGDLGFIDNRMGEKLARRKRSESLSAPNLKEDLLELDTDGMIVTELLDEEGIKLLQRMLMFHPKDRINTQNALRAPYFSDIYQDLKLKYGNPKVADQIEKDEEKLKSREEIENRIWTEMAYIQGYEKIPEPTEDEKNWTL